MYILIDQLEAVEDPRTGNAKRHKLGDILFIAIAAGVAGADTWYEIVEYAHTHEAFFRKYLELPSGIPSHDTFNRVFAIMDTKILEENYQQWIKQYISLKPGDVISTDGKTIRGAGERGDTGYVHMVTACQTETGMSLGQIKVDEKSNEIVAIPKLLDMLEVKGCTITIDAMGCQTKIAEKIIEKKARYVLAVKENQRRLHEEILETVKMVKPTGIHKEVDADHGREEERVCRVYRVLSFISASWNWPKLSALVEVEHRSFNKKTQEESIEKRYFITNMPRGEVARIAHAIRSHWAVENGLHWTLDVVFDEDRSRKRVGNAAENYSRLMRVVMSLLKRDRQRPGFDKPLRRKRKLAAWNTAELERILFGLPGENN